MMSLGFWGDFRGLSLANTARIAALAHFSGPLIRMSLGFADPPVARHEIASFACRRARLLTFNSVPEMRRADCSAPDPALCSMFIHEHPRTPAFARLLRPADTQFLQLQSSRIKDPHHVMSVQSGESIIAFSSDIVCGRRPGKS